MFARIASFVGGDTERMRELSEERMAAGEMSMPAGVSRSMVLIDAAGDRRLFITFFDSREALTAAEETFDRMGDEIPEEIRGRRTSVDVYEVVHEQ